MSVKTMNCSFFKSFCRFISKFNLKKIFSVEVPGLEVLKRMCTKFSLSINFLTGVPHEKIVTLYQEASIYVQASLAESFGVSLAEAMACGCIPIASDSGALPEVVGDSGIIVPYGDRNKLSQEILKILKLNKKEQGKMRTLAAERIKNNFSDEVREVA